MIGCFLVCILGAMQFADRLEVSGTVDVRGAGNYTSAFSGVIGDGECLLAITNSKNGDTEIFRLSPSTIKTMSDALPFQGTSQKTVILKLKPQLP